MLAPLTKATGLVYGVGVACVVAFVLWRDLGRSDDNGASLTSLRWKQAAAAVGGALLALPIAWPALLADPSTQIPAFMDSVALGASGSNQVFEGDLSAPGWFYYVIALPFRMTPWFFLAAIVAVPLALVSRATRARALWLIVWMVPAMLAISQATKQYDRYGLIVVAPLAVLVGVGLGPHLERLLARRRIFRPAAGVVAVGVLLSSVLVAPWGLLYSNPVLGGGERAQDTLLVGWGEGTEIAIDMIRDMENGECGDVTVDGVRTSVLGSKDLPAPLWTFGVACAGGPAPGTEATYLVAYIGATQRMTDLSLALTVAGREQVGSVELRGITIATIWR
jgi:hypothetical protein